MNETQARDEICRVGQSLFGRGYVHGTAGNISVRLDDAQGGGLVMTPTDACLGFLDPARLSRIDAQGQQTSGDRASKSLALHLAIYTAARAFDPATACVIHTHGTHCVAASLESAGSELLPPLTPYFVMKVGHVPLIPYQCPGSATAVAAVEQAISNYGQRGTPLRAVMLARLGPNVWHASPTSAMGVLEELEETARLWMLSGPAARASVLGKTDLNALREAFQARW